MAYFSKVSSFIKEVYDDKTNFGTRGWNTGIPAVDDIYSVKKGFSTVVFSYSHHGKTQWVIDVCVYLAREYGVVSVMYLSEAGKRSEAVLDIMCTLVGKKLEDITDEEFTIALSFIDKYFLFGDLGSHLLTVDKIYEEVAELKAAGVNVGNVTIDHFHTLEKSENQKYFDRADNTKYVINKINRGSLELDVHTFIMFHVRDTHPIQCPDSKIWYLPKPEKEMLSGGQQSSYLAFNMVSIWRPVLGEDKYGIINPNAGVPYGINEAIFSVAKVKPKGSARLGSRSIFFDTDKQRYYSVQGSVFMYAVDSLTNKTAKQESKPSAIQPNLNFDDDDDIF